jgi:uncharacterized membrane protein
VLIEEVTQQQQQQQQPKQTVFLGVCTVVCIVRTILLCTYIRPNKRYASKTMFCIKNHTLLSTTKCRVGAATTLAIKKNR